MSNVVSDYFRFPTGVLDFGLLGELSPPSGFFRFGQDTLCFGRNSTGQTGETPSDAVILSADNLLSGDGRCLVPFDPDEVINNLRFERYLSRHTMTFLQRIVRDAYYFVRPLLPVHVRKHLQRISLRKRDASIFPQFPVDDTVEAIVQKLAVVAMKAKGIERLPFIWFWPKGHSSCAIMTHDVETAAGRDFCSTLMDMNDEFNVKSSFQIVPEARYAVPQSFLDSVTNRGFEVNVHDLNHDGFLFRTHEEFLRRAAKINLYVRRFGAKGYRSAVLYRNMDWYKAFSFSYDMSVPNVGRFDPQPGGCCTIMPYFIGDILELPVTMTQDYSLFNILRTYSLDLWLRQINCVRHKNGLMSFIVHPDYLDNSKARTAYRALLGHLIGLRDNAGVWMPRPAEVNQWWRERNEMRLVQRGNTWHVEGVGSEKACVAYAVVRDGVLAYAC